MRHFLSHQLIKYLIVGGANTIFTGVIFYLIYHVLQLHYLLALIVSWFCGILLTYTFNFLWVFQPEQKLRFQERFVKYFIVYVLSLLINILLLSSLVRITHYDPFCIQIALIPLVVAVNFLLTKYWSLSRL